MSYAMLQTVEHQSMSVSLLFDDISRYLFAIVLVLMGNTLPGLLPGAGNPLHMLALFLCAAVALKNWISTKISKHEAAGWVAWVFLVFLAYSIVFLATGDGRGSYGALSTGFLMVCPLMVMLLIKNGILDKYLQAVVNVVAALAAVSVILWLAGPVFGAISPNCSISNGWTGSGIRIASPGYYHLLYITQYGDLFNMSLARNTGIFAEGPMYSYTISMAIIFESYFSKRPRTAILVILYIAVASTLTTTGIVFVLAIGFVELARRAYAMKSRLRPILLTLLGILFVILTIFAFSLLDQKMDTSSGSIRLDDFRAGFATWIESPIYGYGLSNIDSATVHMGSFRLYNLGFSNSPFDLLVRGGIVFAFPFLVACMGFLRLPSPMKIAALLFVYLWTITIVTFLPLTYLMFSFGVAGLFINRKTRAKGFRKSGVAK